MCAVRLLQLFCHSAAPRAGRDCVPVENALVGRLALQHSPCLALATVTITLVAPAGWWMPAHCASSTSSWAPRPQEASPACLRACGSHPTVPRSCWETRSRRRAAACFTPLMTQTRRPPFGPRRTGRMRSSRTTQTSCVTRAWTGYGPPTSSCPAVSVCCAVPRCGVLCCAVLQRRAHVSGCYPGRYPISSFGAASMCLLTPCATVQHRLQRPPQLVVVPASNPYLCCVVHSLRMLPDTPCCWPSVCCASLLSPCSPQTALSQTGPQSSV